MRECIESLDQPAQTDQDVFQGSADDSVGGGGRVGGSKD